MLSKVCTWINRFLKRLLTSLFPFITPTEAEAAKEAGLNVVLVSRPGNAELSDEEKTTYAVVESFENIPLEAVGGTKRKIEEVTSEQQVNTIQILS